MNKLQTIKRELASDKVKNRLSMALNINGKNEQEVQIIQSYVSSVYYEIEKTTHDPRKDLTKCTIDSICQAMIDAAKFGLQIDGRQHAHLVKYGNNAQMQIGYRGYLYKVSQRYEDVTYSIAPVFEGDEITVKNENGLQEYTHIPLDPFEDDWDKLRGIVFGINYRSGGELFKNVERVSKNDLIKIRNCAKHKGVWNEWPIEKGKAATVKRACKIIFAGIDEIQKMIEFDNEKHFEKVINPEESLLDSIDKALEVDELNHEFSSEES